MEEVVPGGLGWWELYLYADVRRTEGRRPDFAAKWTCPQLVLRGSHRQAIPWLSLSKDQRQVGRGHSISTGNDGRGCLWGSGPHGPGRGLADRPPWGRAGAACVPPNGGPGWVSPLLWGCPLASRSLVRLQLPPGALSAVWLPEALC